VRPRRADDLCPRPVHLRTRARHSAHRHPRHPREAIAHDRQSPPRGRPASGPTARASAGGGSSGRTILPATSRPTRGRSAAGRSPIPAIAPPREAVAPLSKAADVR
jgi:hypothetical protein